MSDTLPPVQHNAQCRRFELVVDDLLSEACYTLDDGVMRMTHTGVPTELEGRGIASALVRSALEHARREGLKVRPSCSYVQAYMRRHPETQDLLAR